MSRPHNLAWLVVPALGGLSWSSSILCQSPQVPQSRPSASAPSAQVCSSDAPQKTRIASGLDVDHFQQGVPGSRHWSLVDVVGGHEGMLTNGKYVLKPMQNGSRGLREAEFYERLLKITETDASVGALFPGYFGVVQTEGGSKRLKAAVNTHDLPAGATWLKLQDMTAGFHKPCVADIKLGTRTWSPGSSNRKRDKAIARYPHQLLAGYRFTGMRVFTSRPETGCLPSTSPAVVKNRKCEGSELQQLAPLDSADSGSDQTASAKSQNCLLLHRRHFGRKLGHLEGSRGWFDFLFDGQRLRFEVIPHLLSQLRQVQTWLSSQEHFEFYSSSLLVVYDADGPPDAVRVRLIDFAHAKHRPQVVCDHPPQRGDRGTLVGIQNLITCLQELQERQDVAVGLPGAVPLTVCAVPETPQSAR